MPALPRSDYQDVTVEFSEPVNIEDFLAHVHVYIGGVEGAELANLRSVGSGQIEVSIGGDAVSKFSGSGDDLHYTWSDMTGGHGPMLISIEWVE